MWPQSDKFFGLRSGTSDRDGVRVKPGEGAGEGVGDAAGVEGVGVTVPSDSAASDSGTTGM